MPIDQQTFDFLKGEWYAAGGPLGAADLAASIAFAESSGCQYALAGPVDIRPVKACTWNKTDKENSCGFWQINLDAHPAYSAPSIFDPATNASAAVLISNHGTDFGPWSTYTDGAYKPFLAKYAGSLPAPPPSPTVPNPDKYGDTETIPGGVWNEGWGHFTKELSHTLPNALVYSQHRRQETLRTLARRRKVIH